MPPAYEIPSYGSSASTLHGWLMEAVSEGDIWLRAQKPTIEWQKVMEVLGPDYAGTGTNPIVGQSNTGYNLVRYDYSQIRATLSNFRNVGEFAPTEDDAQEFFDRAHLLTNLDRNWERLTFPNLVIRDAIGYALGKGTGYLYEDWDKARWGPGMGDIRLRAFDPQDVTFIQLPKSHDIQQAYVVLIREELPLQLAKRMYSGNAQFANALVADHDSPSWIQKGLSKVQQFISPMLRTSGSIRKANDSYPTVDIWHAYSLDGSINETGEPMTMGAHGTNWTYTVPALGDPIPQGVINPATGQPFTLPATPDECLLFPLRRLTIFSRTGTAYDGSSPWWHGAVPLARIRFNDLPWEALGASQIGDAISMQEGIVATMRNVENSIAARLDPPRLYDETRVDKTWAEAFNPTKAGSVAGCDLTQGSPVEFPYPPGQFDVPAWIVGEGGYIKQQEDRIDKITSVRDLVAIAKARQIPSADTLEKLMEMAGPIVQDMVGALIEPSTQLGEWRKAYYFQFYTRQRMIKIADPEADELLKGVKYVPDKLVPYLAQESSAARSARVRSYLSDFRFEVSESGISEINRMGQTLLYVQLKKIGFPLSNYTLARIAKVPNYGPPPKGTNTEFERWLAEQRMDMELKLEFAKETAEIQAQIQGGTPGGGGMEAPLGSNGNEGGRPPSFSAPPKLVSKDGGTRSTITTS